MFARITKGWTYFTRTQDYISLTDMVRNAGNSDIIIANQMRNKDTIECLCYERALKAQVSEFKFFVM